MKKINSTVLIAIGVLSAGMTSSVMAEESKIIPDKSISKDLATCAAYFYYEGQVKDKESSILSSDYVIKKMNDNLRKTLNDSVLYGGNEYAMAAYNAAFQVIKKNSKEGNYKSSKYEEICDFVIDNIDHWVKIRKDGAAFSCESDKEIKRYKQKINFKLAIPDASALAYRSLSMSSDLKSKYNYSNIKFFGDSAIGFIADDFYSGGMEPKSFIATAISSGEKGDNVVLHGFSFGLGNLPMSVTVKKTKNLFVFYLHDSRSDDEIVKGSCKKVGADVFLM